MFLKSELIYAIEGEHVSARRGLSPQRADNKGLYWNLGEPKLFKEAVEEQNKMQ